MMASSIEQMIEPRERDLGGFSVRRVLPFVSRKMVGPFIFFDHMGPATFAPGKGIDVRAHPHIGLSTVTYLFEGALRHKDTVGADIVIRPGAVNWMTAGKGIVHSERTPDAERDAGHTIHGIQTWLALPKSHEAIAPAFVHHAAETLPAFELGGAQLRLLAGKAWGHESPVEFPWDIWYLAGEGNSGMELDIPADAAPERAVYVAEGHLSVDDTSVPAGSMAVLKPERSARLRAREAVKFMLAGGAAMDGPRKIEWNLVASEQGSIDQAFVDWSEAVAKNFEDTRFSLPAGETEWIPMPQRP